MRKNELIAARDIAPSVRRFRNEIKIADKRSAFDFERERLRVLSYVFRDLTDLVLPWCSVISPPNAKGKSLKPVESEAREIRQEDEEKLEEVVCAVQTLRMHYERAVLRKRIRPSSPILRRITIAEIAISDRSSPMHEYNYHFASVLSQLYSRKRKR